jgi:hypothetical protein
MDKGDIEIIKQAIKDIEHWRGYGYVEGDDIDNAVKLIKETINKEPTVNAQFDEEDMWINCPHCDNTEQQPVDQQRHHLQSLVLLDWESEKISKHQCLSCDGLFKVNWESYESEA